ncbi:MAG: zinc ABC transporter substrate-binding protein [Bacteroidetes bacterium]|nr:zinc ABC transporter substrate-binding protein [Bacteroidota bacterium]
MARTNIIIVGIALLLCACTPPADNEKPLVVTSIAPIGDWIAAVGGADIDVLVLVPPSSSPHTFELSPGQLRDASRAALVVLNGAGLEYWSDRLLDNIQDKHTPVLRLSDRVELLQAGHDDHAGHNHGNVGNPHFWLDPSIAAGAVRDIAQSLGDLLPMKRDSITARAAVLAASLEQLDREISSTVRLWRQRRFIGDHSSWVYFARRYGLEEAGVIESVPGREVSARQMTSLISTMRKHGVDVVFADRRKSTRAADILAEETGARIARLDPMGAEGEGYIQMMRTNLNEMTRVMR